MACSVLAEQTAAKCCSEICGCCTLIPTWSWSLLCQGRNNNDPRDHGHLRRQRTQRMSLLSGHNHILKWKKIGGAPIQTEAHKLIHLLPLRHLDHSVDGAGAHRLRNHKTETGLGGTQSWFFHKVTHFYLCRPLIKADTVRVFVLLLASRKQTAQAIWCGDGCAACTTVIHVFADAPWSHTQY